MKYTNAYWQGNSLFAVTRNDEGAFQIDQFPAEHAFFIRSKDSTPERIRSIRDSRYCLGMAEEGEWIRFRWKYDRADFHEAVHVKIAKFIEDTHKIPTFEADVSPVRRWVIDNSIEISIPRRCYLDIETDSRVPFSKKAEARVLAWTVVGEGDGSEVFAGLSDEDSDEAERACLTALWGVLGRYDQVLAWNGDRFDFPMIADRSKAVGIVVDTRRWLWLDHLVLFRRMNMSASESGDEKQSMSLESVARAVCGEGKLAGVSGAKSWEMWCDARGKLLDYCARDADLMRKIEAKTGYVGLLQTLVEATRVFPDSYGIQPSGQVESFLMMLAKKRSLRFPSHFRTDDVEKFAGAYVMDPSCNGIARDVHVADFARLYPSIIMSWNMSLETHRPDVRLMESAEGRPVYLSHLPLKRNPIPDGHCAAAITDVVFANEPLGILPEAVTEMIRLRAYWNKKKASLPPGTAEWVDADRRSSAYKMAANSFYGVIGMPHSRFYVRQLAESVSQCGVWLIKETIEAARLRGYDVIYGDSVTGDRVIVTRDRKGMVRLLPISELWRLSSSRTFGRDKEFGCLFGWKSLSRDLESGVDGWFPITSIVRHKSGKLTSRLTTKHGQTQVTSDHSLIVNSKEVSPSEFVSGNLKFDCVRAPVEEPIDCIDLMDYIGDFEDSYSYKGRIVCRKFESRGDRIVLIGWGVAEKVSVPRYYRVGTIEFDALIRLVSAYVSDGSSSLRGRGACRNLLSFCKADLQLMSGLASDLKLLLTGGKVFGPYWSDTVFVVRSGTTMATCLFAALCGSGCKNKRFPSFVFSLDAYGFSLVQEGLRDGDGYTDASGNVLFTTTSAQLAAGVSYVWSQHGVEHSFSYRESKGAWMIRTRATGSERSNYSIKQELFEPIADEYVYDLSVEGAHTFSDAIGRVLLHNTDSIFVRGVSKDDFDAFVKWCNTDLYPGLMRSKGCTRNFTELAYEKAFERITFVSSKRYVGRYSHYKGTAAAVDSKPEIKGLEYKRGDVSRLTRAFQAEAIGLMMAGDDVPGPLVFEEVIERWKVRILEGDLEKSDIVISKRLARPLGDYKRRTKLNGDYAAEPAHVAVARLLKEKGVDVGEGTKIGYIVVDGSASPLGVVSETEWTGEFDRFYLWENLVYPATRRLLAAAYPAHDWARWDRVRPAKVRAAPKPRAFKVVKKPQNESQGSLFAQHDQAK